MSARYGTDLAFVHDAGFGGFARERAPRLIARLRRVGARRVVELGCGSGAATCALARAGFSVLGIDASKSMIALARRRAPKASLRVARIPSAKIPPCDAVVAVGEVLNYMSKPSDFDALFERVFAALAPGGIFLFDAKLPSGPSRGIVRGRFARDWAVLAESDEDARGRLTRRIASFRRVGGRWRRTDEVHRLVLLSAREVLRRLRKAGFSARFASGTFVARR
jgi:SAM-dependent methyltransferase